jgi:hypothetical protein
MASETGGAVAPTRHRGRVAARRLGSPLGLAGVLLCLLLPFLTASCSGGSPEAGLGQKWRVTWTGVDVIAGGRPDVAWAGADDPGPPRRLSDAEVVDLLGEPPSWPGTQPFGWAALILVVAALAVAASGATRRRAAITAGLALVAGLALLAATLLAREQAVDMAADVLRGTVAGPDPSSDEPVRNPDLYRAVRDLFRFGYGFWLASGALFLVGMTNVALAVPDRRPP